MRKGTRRRVTLPIVRTSIAWMVTLTLRMVAPTEFALFAIEIVRLLVEPRDQRLDAAAAQGRSEIRAPRRQLADRAGKIDVADLPGRVIVVQRIVDGDPLAVGLDDMGAHQRRVRGPLLA